MAVKPKLAMIPSGVGVGKLYSVLPSDGTGYFDFSRSGNATRINKQGLIETVSSNVPRLNYPLIDGVVSGCPSLLLEPSRSNLFPYSEDFENSDWTKNAGTTITNNYAISPDGTLNASRYLGTGASGLGDKFTLSATEYTISFYVKSNTGQNQFCRIIIDSSNVSNNIEVTTEWKRITFTAQGSGLSNKTNGIFRDSNNNDIDILIWGAQLEQGSYATSYIPTQGSAVTRVAETCSQTPPSGIIGQTEGTMYVDVDINTLSTDGQVLRLTNGTSGFGRIVIERNPSNQNQIRVTQWGGSILTFSISIGNRYKIAVGYDSSNSNVYVNGSSIGTSFFTNVAELNKVSLGCNEVGGSIFNDTIKETKLYNTRLSNAELQALTS